MARKRAFIRHVRTHLRTDFALGGLFGVNGAKAANQLVAQAEGELQDLRSQIQTVGMGRVPPE